MLKLFNKAMQSTVYIRPGFEHCSNKSFEKVI